ncbi:MAG: sigma-54 dependent transcriptional regulator, partial [Spirochaetota bacterium]
IPDTLLESELFGYEPGAFTDAKKKHKGKFEQAEGGTIFLDEIGDMSLKTQAKLLRVIQEKEYERLGSTTTLRANIRFITATNKNIRSLIEKEIFREDLFYRISVVTIDLPPLRDRQDDILVLAENFREHFCKMYSKRIERITDPIKQILLEHNWPGNIRELKNCIERAVIFCENAAISEEDLPSQYKKSSKNVSVTIDSMYDSISKQMILDALDKCDGRKQAAAKLLNIHRKTLYNKIKKLGIE